jgi:hypothetical protein
VNRTATHGSLCRRALAAAVWGTPRRARRAACLAATALGIANPLLHEQMSVAWGWLTEGRMPGSADRIALLGVSAVGLVVVAAGLRAQRRFDRQLLTALAVLLAATGAWQHFLLVANIELVHVPQYALLAAVLVCGGIRPGEALIAATLAGVVDEAYQCFVLYVGRPDTYLDFNDMFLNAVGAAWGVLLMPPPAWAASAPAGVTTDDAASKYFRLAALAAGLLLAAYFDPPTVTPFFRQAATGRMYHVMSACEALLWSAVVYTVTVNAARGRETAPLRRSGHAARGQVAAP